MNLRKWLLMNEAGAESTTSGGTAGTATPAPAAEAPAGEPSVDASGPSSSDVELFASEADEGDEAGSAASESAPAAAAKPAEEAKPASSEAKPAEGAPAAKPAEGAPAAPKPGEAAAAPAAAPAAKPDEKPVVQETPEAKAAREAEEKAASEKQFNTLMDHYKIPDDMAVKLATEPENVLPWLAAKLHQNLSQQLAQYMEGQLPARIQFVQRIAEAETKAKAAFYAENDDLQAEKHEEMVIKAGSLFRQMNPTADAQTAAFAVGNMVRSALGLPQRAPKGSGSAAAPVTSVAAPAAAAAAPAFSPAGSSAAAGAAPQRSSNEFEALATEED